MSRTVFYYPRFNTYERVAKVEGNKVYMDNGVIYHASLINRLKKKKLLKEYEQCTRKR